MRCGESVKAHYSLSLVGYGARGNFVAELGVIPELTMLVAGTTYRQVSRDHCHSGSAFDETHFYRTEISIVSAVSDRTLKRARSTRVPKDELCS